MKHDRKILDWLTQDMDFPLESIPGKGIVELAGTNRCLIENHHGVIQYSSTQIGVKMNYGKIIVCGCNLELQHMSKEQLVISGKIEKINLNQEGNP